MTDTQVDPYRREYLPPFSTSGFGLAIMSQGVPADPDSQQVAVVMVNESDGSTTLSGNATRVTTGQYVVNPTPQQMSVSGNYTVTWTYGILGMSQEYRTYLTIGQSNPEYDSLTPMMQDVVETTLTRFADAFDSPAGGPNLQTYFQTHFDRGRVAQLLRIAVATLNTVAQPYQTYTIDGVGGAVFPMQEWGGLLERALYIECLKHLVRSYVEQPMISSGENITRADRRDYMDRWRSVLNDEQELFRSQSQTFKIASMGLGRPSVLIGGGVFGRFAPTRAANSIAARPRMWARFYAFLLIAGGVGAGLHSSMWSDQPQSPGVSAVSTAVVRSSTSGLGK